MESRLSGYAQSIDQNEAPILDAIRAFRAAEPTLFTVHGHKLGAGVDDYTLDVLGADTFRADIAAIKGLDDRIERKRVIERAGQLASEVFGAKQTFLLVNGSTSSVQTALLALGGPDDEIIVARNSHKSVIGGLILGGQRPVFVRPDFDDELRIAHPVTLAAVEHALAEHPGAKAAMIVSPSYYGVAADVEGMARACHARGVPLAVDDAWGVHFGFHPDLPPSGLQAGADLTIGSVHKTVGGLAAASIMSVQGDLVDADVLKSRIDMLQTTSPSTPVLASIDGWRRVMALDGERIMQRVLDLSARARAAIGAIDGLLVMGEEVLAHPGAAQLDPSKLVVDLVDLPVTGYEAWDYLDREHHVVVELEDHRRLVAIITPADDVHSVDRLVTSLRDLAQWARGRPCSRIDLPPSSSLATELVMTPRDAYFGASESVPLRDAVGRVAAEMASPYPPGVPVIVPGERVTAAIVDYLHAVVTMTALVPDAHDPKLETLKVVA